MCASFFVMMGMKNALTRPVDLHVCDLPRISSGSQGNEGVEVKEGSTHCRIENNEVNMQHDPDSGGGRIYKVQFLTLYKERWPETLTDHVNPSNTHFKFCAVSVY